MATVAFDRLTRALTQRPEHPVLIGEDETLDAATLDAQSRQWSARLRAQGLRRGERVAVLVGSYPRAVAVMLVDVGQKRAWGVPVLWMLDG